MEADQLPRLIFFLLFDFARLLFSRALLYVEYEMGLPPQVVDQDKE